MNRRAERLTSQIERELGAILHRKVKDPRIGFLTITRTEVSPDLSFARVYYTVYGDEEDIREAREALDRAGGYIRHELGQTLGTRLTPELRFEFDTKYLEGMAVIDMIQRLDLVDRPDDEPEPEGT
jgi:ribosome-binding factor A